MGMSMEYSSKQITQRIKRTGDGEDQNLFRVFVARKKASSCQGLGGKCFLMLWIVLKIL